MGCGPSEEEIQQVVDARVAPLETELQERGHIETKAEAARRAAEEAAKVDWQRSADFLAQLDRLMADYEPNLPPVSDDTNILACITNAGFAADPGLKAAQAALYADLRASERNRAEVREAFERRRWLQYRIDYDWQNRVASSFTPPEEVCDRWGDCWTRPGRHVDASGGGDYDFAGQALYSRTTTPEMPELMKRIAAEGVEVPERFYCKVESSDLGNKADGYPLFVGCASSRVTAYLRIVGAMSPPHAGDILSVPLRDKVISPAVLSKGNGDPRPWVLRALADETKLETPAECPSDETIAVTALAKTKAPATRNVLLEMLRAARPTTPEGKRLLADDALRRRDYAAAGAIYQELGDINGMAAAANGLAKANEAEAAINLLKGVVSTRKDAGLLVLLGGLEVQAGQTASGQGHLREGVREATDLKTVKNAQAVLQFSGDDAGVDAAKAKACALGDKRSCN
jgi:hypothetical protein